MIQTAVRSFLMAVFYADMKIFFDVSVALLAVIWYNKKAEAKNLFCSQKKASFAHSAA